jgi:hypothetical protein
MVNEILIMYAELEMMHKEWGGLFKWVIPPFT